MERDTILENFQAITQNHNFEECIQILESVNWDLEKALDGLEHLSDFSIPLTEDSFILPMSLQTRHIMFKVDADGNKFDVEINENKTIGDLFNLIYMKSGNNSLNIRINSVKQLYDNNTILSTLNLPMNNDVVATSIETPYTFTSESNNDPFTLKIDIYKRGIFKQVLSLTLSGKDAISKVKNQVAVITGSDKSKHKWSGWPSNIFGSEVALNESGLISNTTLIVDIDPPASSDGNSNLRPDLTMETSVNNTRTDNIDDDDDDDYYDESIDTELIEETCPPTKKCLSLMEQGAHLDPIVATLNFSNEFEKRFCSISLSEDRTRMTKNTSQSTSTLMKPPFFIGSLDEAINQTLNLPPTERKPLFIYIHHGESIQTNIFCIQTLCFSEICLYFHQSDFSLWPWDITYPENKSQLVTWITRAFGSAITGRLRIISKDDYPIIVAVGKSQGSYELLEVYDNNKNKEEILQSLWELKLRFDESQQPDIKAWEDRKVRELVKQEQDAAYKESLLLDQEKEKRRINEETKIREAEARRLSAEEKEIIERFKLIEEAKNKLPVEPAENEDIITIRLRAPSGMSNMKMNSLPSVENMTRRFLPSHTLQHVIWFMESLGFLRSEFKLLTTYPKKNLTQTSDFSITLKELGIPRRENLIIENI